MREKIGESLVQAGLISTSDLQAALTEQKSSGDRLGVVLARLNLATEHQVASALAAQLGFPCISLVDNPPEPLAVARIARDVAVAAVCIGVTVDNHQLTVAMADPLRFSLIEDLERETGCRVRLVVAAGSDIVHAIGAAYPTNRDHRETESDPTPHAATIDRSGDAPSVIDVMTRVLRTAIANQATDVHVDPMDDGTRIRHRLDGSLTDVIRLEAGLHEPLVAAVKTMAGMDVGETRLSQDGRLRMQSDGGNAIDFGVFTLRTRCGEKVVLRPLDDHKPVLPLEQLGMSTTALDMVRALLCRRPGMIVVAGPARSGKTTTLSAIASALQSAATSVVSVEDPIEYRIPGVNQVRIDHGAARTAATVMAAILRQNPDVVLLDEVRDADTARLATDAAAAGCLVIGAVRSDDASTAVASLMNCGIDPHIAAATLLGAVGQRLVRRLCAHCRRPSTPAIGVLRALGVMEAEAETFAFYQAVGCDQCDYTGYRGRFAVVEVMRVTDTLRRLIRSDASEGQIRGAAIGGGMVTVGEGALACVKNGTTSVEELRRVVSDLRQPRMLCGACGAAVAVDFNACPACGTRIGGRCPQCGRAIQAGWNYCPYCTRHIDSGPSPA